MLAAAVGGFIAGGFVAGIGDNLLLPGRTNHVGFVAVTLAAVSMGVGLLTPLVRSGWFIAAAGTLIALGAVPTVGGDGLSIDDGEASALVLAAASGRSRIRTGTRSLTRALGCPQSGQNPCGSRVSMTTRTTWSATRITSATRKLSRPNNNDVGSSHARGLAAVGCERQSAWRGHEPQSRTDTPLKCGDPDNPPRSPMCSFRAPSVRSPRPIGTFTRVGRSRSVSSQRSSRHVVSSVGDGSARSRPL